MENITIELTELQTKVLTMSLHLYMEKITELDNKDYYPTYGYHYDAASDIGRKIDAAVSNTKGPHDKKS
jgi:hypothetical protein